VSVGIVVCVSLLVVFIVEKEHVMPSTSRDFTAWLNTVPYSI